VPLKSEDIRVASRAAGTCGGWAALRGALDAIDWTSPEGRRALRAAVGTRNARALQSPKAWNQLRPKAPRLPAAEDIGIGSASDEGSATRRRRRRRRKMSTADVAGSAANGSVATPASQPAEAPAAPPATGNGDAPGEGTAAKRRRRRRRRRSSATSGGGEGAPPTAPPDGE